MGQLTIAGTLLGGPVQVGAGFPQAIYTTQLALSQTPRPFSKGSGVVQSTVNTPSPSYEPLQGVGPTDRVRYGDVLYLRCDGSLELRISQTDPLNPLGPPLVRLLNVQGLQIMEFPPSSRLVLLEAQGSATVEYAIFGS